MVIGSAARFDGGRQVCLQSLEINSMEKDLPQFWLDFGLILILVFLVNYRGELKGLYVLLSRTQAGPGRAVKQEQEENSRNHVQAF